MSEDKEMYFYGEVPALIDKEKQYPIDPQQVALIKQDEVAKGTVFWERLKADSPLLPPEMLSQLGQLSFWGSTAPENLPQAA